MIDQPRAFLPPEALTCERIRQALSEPLDGWSRAWFASASVGLAPGAAPRASVGEDQADACGQEARLLLSGGGKRRLIEAALGNGLEGKVLSPADRQLLDTFLARIASDLAERVDRLLGSGEGPQLRLEMTLGGRPIGTLRISRHAVTALVRRGLPASCAKTAFPSSRAEAIACLPIEVEAVLGRAQLTIEDANGLAAGDVIVLDRRLDENAEIRLDDGRALVAEGRLVPESGGNSLIIDTSGKGLN